MKSPDFNFRAVNRDYWSHKARDPDLFHPPETERCPLVLEFSSKLKVLCALTNETVFRLILWIQTNCVSFPQVSKDAPRLYGFSQALS